MDRLVATSAVAIAALVLASCASTRATQMSADTIKIDANTAPVCAGQTNEIMMRRAGVETIRRGYDKYILLNHGTGSVVTGVNEYGQLSRAGTGSVIVKMFKANDPAGAKALSARDLLGPDWQEIVNKKEKSSCL